MRIRLCILAPLPALVTLVTAQAQNNINVPSGGFNFTAGEPATITWENPSSRTVTIQLVPASGVGIVNLITGIPATSLSATFTIPSDVATSQKYTLKIIDDSNSSNVDISTPFTITAGPAATSTSTSPTPASGQPTPSSTPSTTSSDPSQSTSPSLSTGAIVGIAIGGGVIGFAFCSLLFYCFRRRRRRRQQEREQRHLQSSFSATKQEQQYYSPQHQASHSSTGGISGHPPPAPEYPYSGGGTVMQTNAWSQQGHLVPQSYQQQQKQQEVKSLITGVSRPTEIHRTITEVTGSSRHPSELDSHPVKSQSRSPGPGPRSTGSDQSPEQWSARSRSDQSFELSDR